MSSVLKWIKDFLDNFPALDKIVVFFVFLLLFTIIVYFVVRSFCLLIFSMINIYRQNKLNKTDSLLEKQYKKYVKEKDHWVQSGGSVYDRRQEILDKVKKSFDNNLWWDHSEFSLEEKKFNFPIPFKKIDIELEISSVKCKIQTNTDIEKEKESWATEFSSLYYSYGSVKGKGRFVVVKLLKKGKQLLITQYSDFEREHCGHNDENQSPHSQFERFLEEKIT